jgi:hypothetical protein
MHSGKMGGLMHWRSWCILHYMYILLIQSDNDYTYLFLMHI